MPNYDGAEKPQLVSASQSHPRQGWNRFQVILSIALHVILVAVHVVLVHHLEHRVTTATGPDANRMGTIVTVVSQTVGTVSFFRFSLSRFLSSNEGPMLTMQQVYATILVLLTQRPALRRDVHAEQTLSALQDRSKAWLGLGSSVLVLWDKVKLRTAPWWVMLIALYLAGIFVFHITTPSLFDVVPYNATSTTQTTQLGRVIPLINSTRINDAGN